MATKAIGTKGVLGFAKESTFGVAVNPTALWIEAAGGSESFGQTPTVGDATGIYGGLDPILEASFVGSQDVQGGWQQYLTHEIAATLLEMITGATNGVPADALPSYTIAVERGDKKFTYAGCVCKQATFSSEQGGPLTLAVSVAGASEAIGSTGFSPTFLRNDAVFCHHHGVATINSVEYDVRSFQLSITNVLQEDLFYTNQSRQALPFVARSCEGTLLLDLDADTDDLLADIGSIAGIPIQVVYTDGSANTITFDIAKAVILGETPKGLARQVVPFNYGFRGAKSGSGNLYQITLSV